MHHSWLKRVGLALVFCGLAGFVAALGSGCAPAACGSCLALDLRIKEAGVGTIPEPKENEDVLLILALENPDGNWSVDRKAFNLKLRTNTNKQGETIPTSEFNALGSETENLPNHVHLSFLVNTPPTDPNKLPDTLEGKSMFLSVGLDKTLRGEVASSFGLRVRIELPSIVSDAKTIQVTGRIIKVTKPDGEVGGGECVYYQRSKQGLEFNKTSNRDKGTDFSGWEKVTDSHACL